MYSFVCFVVQGHGNLDAPGGGSAEKSSGHHDQGDLGHGLGDAATNSGNLLYISLALVVVLIGGLVALLVYGLYRTRTAHPQQHHHHQNGHHHCSSTRVVSVAYWVTVKKKC